jgi:wyosine [tRNA(Phe)-imidazoG37] synthetase (radical SAM superfamily)
MNEIVRGPERTSDGKSLLVNPTCETARANTFPSQALVVTTAARRLIELSKAGERLNSVIVSGDIDPTLNPDFREISENLRELCNKWHPKADLTLITEGRGLDNAESRQCLSLYDRPILVFEAGTQKTFGALTGDKPQLFKDVVDNLSRIENERIVVRACFLKGDADNSKDTEVRAWLRYLTAIRPSKVQVTTLGKAETKRKGKAIPRKRLEAIANLVADKTGLQVEIVDPE